MLPLRVAAVHTRIPRTISTSSSLAVRRPITTSGNNSKHDLENPLNVPRGSSVPMTHAPGWNETLATASEAAVKADHETATINEMRQKTVDFQSVHQRDPEVVPTHATYAREEIGGPLGSAGFGEFEGVMGKEDLGPDEAQVESDGRIVTRRTTFVHEKPGTGQANV